MNVSWHHKCTPEIFCVLSSFAILFKRGFCVELCVRQAFDIFLFCSVQEGPIRVFTFVFREVYAKEFLSITSLCLHSNGFLVKQESCRCVTWLVFPASVTSSIYWYPAFWFDHETVTCNECFYRQAIGDNSRQYLLQYNTTVSRHLTLKRPIGRGDTGEGGGAFSWQCHRQFRVSSILSCNYSRTQKIQMSFYKFCYFFWSTLLLNRNKHNRLFVFTRSHCPQFFYCPPSLPLFRKCWCRLVITGITPRKFTINLTYLQTGL